MEFKPIELSVYEDYMNHYRQCMISCAETSFMTVYLEGVAFDVLQAFEHDFYWHKMNWDHKPAWLPPVGDWDSVEDWQALLTELVPAGTTFVFVPAYLLRKWQAFSDRLKVENMRSEWDYVYSIQRQVDAQGKDYHNWRSTINHFAKCYPDWKYEPITAAITNEIKAFQAEWMAENEHTDKMTDELRGENKTTIFMLDNWENIPGAIGGVLRVEGRIVAFIVVEKLDENMSNGQFLKADHNYVGAARFLKNEVFKRLLPKYVTDRQADIFLNMQLNLHPDAFFRRIELQDVASDLFKAKPDTRASIRQDLILMQETLNLIHGLKELFLRKPDVQKQSISRDFFVQKQDRGTSRQ